MILMAVLSDVISGTSPSHCSPAGSSLDMTGFAQPLRYQRGFQGLNLQQYEILEYTMRRTLDTIIGNRKRIL